MQQTQTLDSVLSMGRGGDSTQFIGAAAAALARGVESDDLRLLMMRRLIERGLLGRARAYTEGLSEELRTHPEIVGVRRKLDSATNNGEMCWRSLALRFEANMTLLRRRYDWASRVADVWDSEQQYMELHVAADGSRQVFDRRPESGGWRPAFGNHTPQPSAEDLAAEFKDLVQAPFVIDGVGLGYQLPWLHTATADTFLGASAVIYQIERSFLALAVALHLNDWRECIADERVRLCCGPDAYGQFERLVEADTWNPPPIIVVNVVPWDTKEVLSAEQRVQRFKTRAVTELAALQESVSALYRGRDRRWWHRRYVAAASGKEPPLRVLGITSRFTTVLQYTVRDALKAFEANGCRTSLLIEPNDHARLTFAQKLRAIRDFSPDLILLIDHTRHGQRAGLIDDVPLVTWVQDRLEWLFSRESGESMGPLDFCMGFARNELVQHYGYPAERFLSCEMATHPASLGHRSEGRGASLSAGVSEGVDPELSCDVAFATNRGKSMEGIREELRQCKIPAVEKLMDAVYEGLQAKMKQSVLNGALDCEHFLRTTEQSVGIELTQKGRHEVALGLVRTLVDRLIRRQTIDWAVSWAEQTGRRFHLYGHGWDTHPEYSKVARGYIEHGPRLGRAFLAAKINLHAGTNHAFHQRVLDGLAAGGFFLIRRHADDVWYRFYPVIAEIARKRKLRLHDPVCLDDIPPEFKEDWIANRRMRGVSPNTPYRVEQVYLNHGVDASGQVAIFSPMQVWPDFDRITFGTQAELVDRLESFLQDDERRRAMANSMRENMLEVFGYEALMKRLLIWIKETLSRA